MDCLLVLSLNKGDMKIKLLSRLDNLTKKQLRIGLGIVMMFCFLAAVQFVYFFLRIGFSPRSFVIAMFIYYWMWLPNMCLLLLIYYLLTRVYPYEDSKKEKAI